MDIKQIEYPSGKEFYNKQLFNIEDEDLSIQCGTVFLVKGTRVPENGFSRHEQHEISFIQEGEIELINEDGSTDKYLKSGDVVFIRALEAQAGNVLEDTRIIYVLIGKATKNK